MLNKTLLRNHRHVCRYIVLGLKFSDVVRVISFFFGALVEYADMNRGQLLYKIRDLEEVSECLNFLVTCGTSLSLHHTRDREKHGNVLRLCLAEEKTHYNPYFRNVRGRRSKAKLQLCFGY